MKSEMADRVGCLLSESFPFVKIKEEFSVDYGGHHLYVDFFIPAFMLAFEVHGEQHFGFVGFFHGDSEGWRKHKLRDNVKKEWAENNSITLVIIDKRNEPKTKDDLLLLIDRSKTNA